jgi:hypothetical protein
MRNYLLGGIAIASAFTFMIASAPASAAGGCGNHPCISPHAGNYRAAGAGPGQFHNQQHGYAHGYGRGHGDGIGLGVGAALVTGAIIGGAMEQNQDYYPVESYPADSYPVYSDQGPLYDAGGALVANDGNSVAYCQQTYRSYDPASGTYLGYDGMRHACP